MEIEEIVRIAVFVLLLVVLSIGAVAVFGGKGADLLGSIGDLLRFGR